MRLENKIAIITGGGDGLGQASAVLFAKEGASVVVADMDPARGMKTVDMIKNQNGEAMFVEVDVSKEDSVKNMVEKVVDAYGRIDILVNSAGIFIEATVLNTSVEDWDKIMAVNLRGIFLGCKYVIPEMIKAGKGSIVNIGSEAGITGWENATAYAASKGGVVNMTRCLALDFAEHNIRANCVCPGTTETPMLKKALAIAPDPKKARRFFEARPLLRLGRPEEIAAGILYLASDESLYATGAILSIDGGKTAGGFNA
jgi:meso-butanediol dehydrogenase/(S,S)-butanediol dehydrogenase/diacetyl reductase